jgi:hypothetical protein
MTGILGAEHMFLVIAEGLGLEQRGLEIGPTSRGGPEEKTNELD